ncbi:hypothetical protein LJC33_00380 [Eubacteriales bacterium OttesenSCG-928-N13]|nr:hypothetical protein [Eubacteriales bacterium OttesenSCG-928-N13]
MIDQINKLKREGELLKAEGAPRERINQIGLKIAAKEASLAKIDDFKHKNGG